MWPSPCLSHSLSLFLAPARLPVVCAMCAEEWRDSVEVKTEWEKQNGNIRKKILCVTWSSASGNHAKHWTLKWTPFDLKNVEPGMTNSLHNHYLHSLHWGLNALAAVFFLSCQLDIWRCHSPGFKWVHIDPEDIWQRREIKGQANAPEMYWEPKSKKIPHYEFRTDLQGFREPEGSIKGQSVLSKMKNVYYFIY